TGLRRLPFQRCAGTRSRPRVGFREDQADAGVGVRVEQIVFDHQVERAAADYAADAEAQVRVGRRAEELIVPQHAGHDGVGAVEQDAGGPGDRAVEDGVGNFTQV